jgi:hypothetical protein
VAVMPNRTAAVVPPDATGQPLPWCAPASRAPAVREA